MSLDLKVWDGTKWVGGGLGQRPTLVARSCFRSTWQGLPETPSLTGSDDDTNTLGKTDDGFPEPGDLCIIAYGRDAADGRVSAMYATPPDAGGFSPSARGWLLAPMASVQGAIVRYRLAASGEPDFESGANYTLVATGGSGTVPLGQGAGCQAFFRGVGDVQSDARSSYSYGNTAPVIPQFDVNLNNSVALLIVVTGVPAAAVSLDAAPPGGVWTGNPSGWTHLATASRWFPAVSMWYRSVDQGSFPSQSLSDIKVGSYQSTFANSATVLVLQPTSGGS